MNAKKHNSDTTQSKDTTHLSRLGWTSFFQAQLKSRNTRGYIPARVVGVRRNNLRISDGERVWAATIAGKLRRQTNDLYPVTGDWVLVKDTVIYEVLERTNLLSRGLAGTRGKQDTRPKKEQIIAANIDIVFIVCGLDQDFNLHRIERYLTLVYNCGLKPVIILTKADLHDNPEEFAEKVESIAFDVPLHLVSSEDEQGLMVLEQYLDTGQTTTMMGSSGAGKSTLVNRLYGEEIQATGAVSDAVGKGKHTTTTRDLIVMPTGGMIIDNPGIREIVFWEDEDGVTVTFPDIEELAAQCRFPDCSHIHEPGCRILQAVADKEISPDRLESYRKMKNEQAYRSDREHKSADRVEKERWKDVALKIKAMKKKR